MRWLFHDPDDRDETAERKRVLKRINDWWTEFEEWAPAIGDLFSGKKKWDLPGWMQDTLGAVHPRIMWEYGPAVRTKGHRLVITPESRKDLRQLVRTIVDRAPELPGWEFYPYRLAEDLEQARNAVKGRTGASLDGVTAELQIGAGNRIDVLFRSPTTRDEDDKKAREIAFVATEVLLGERALDRWVGSIEVAPPRQVEKPGRTISLGRLKDTFDSLVDRVRDDLPGRPYMDRSAKTQWSLIELKPVPADDYPGDADLLVATTCDVELWKAMHRAGPFYSQRFSRCKESFVYVKMDGAHRRPGAQAEERGKIEDALDDALARDGLGVHVSGGTGLRYSYIDLALTDLERGVERARRALRKAGVDDRSWILFFDADLSAEWVGVFPETPPPPSEAEDD